LTIDRYSSIFYFLGEFLLKFNEGIVENEPEVTPKPRLIAKNNLFYPIQKRSSTAYIRINEQCLYCKKSDAKAGSLI